MAPQNNAAICTVALSSNEVTNNEDSIKLHHCTEIDNDVIVQEMAPLHTGVKQRLQMQLTQWLRIDPNRKRIEIDFLFFFFSNWKKNSNCIWSRNDTIWLCSMLGETDFANPTILNFPIHLPNLLTTGRMQRKLILWSDFSSFRLVDVPMLKSLIFYTISLLLSSKEKRWVQAFPKESETLSCPRFELGSASCFPVTITVTLLCGN